MAEKNFMTAGTEIEGLIDKKTQIIKKISNELADACVTRAKSGKVSGALANDIQNTINSLPMEDQRDILLALAVTLSHQINGGQKRTNDDNSSMRRSGDIFSSRRF